MRTPVGWMKSGRQDRDCLSGAPGGPLARRREFRGRPDFIQPTGQSLRQQGPKHLAGLARPAAGVSVRTLTSP